MDISNYTDYLQTTNTNTAASATRAANKDYSTATDEELMDACKEFEAYMIEQVMKEVEKMADISDDEEDESMSQLTDYFKEQTVQSLAEQVSDSGQLGLAQKMYEQMKRNYGVD
ncbi:MAG: rod-binding protein [Lachnospiraceae bacterium]|nr:rod-binding protein [Lachnospiraceae bacterium]